MSITTFPVFVPEKKLQPYYDKIHHQADKITRGFMIAFFLQGIFLAFFHGTYLIAFVMGGISLILYFLLSSAYPHSQILRIFTGFLFWNFGVQFLLQMRGLFEMDFLFFISLTVLLFYEDWKVFIIPTLYAILTLTLIYVFRHTEFARVYFENAQAVSFLSFIIHISSILFYAGLCMWWAWLQHGQTREAALGAVMMVKQLETMEINKTFADSISQGNLNAAYGTEQHDELGASLLNMRDSLVVAAQREEREKFFNIGLARVGEILRQHADNVDNLTDKVIEEVVHYMKANQGSIFVKHKDELQLKAARAWDRKKHLEKTIAIGEGLVGQAAIEKQSILMTKVPDHYITITSGLGEANPRCILIVPLKLEDEVVGVIELASFTAYEDYHVKFMEKVGESIASTIITTENYQKNQDLLKKSGILTEQMRAQEAEIRHNMEEMHATHEEMERKTLEIERLLNIANEKEKTLEKHLEEVEKIKNDSEVKNQEILAHMQNYRKTLLDILDQLPHKIFLKDNEGKMVMVNTVVAKAHNMSIDELIGKSDFDFVDPETARQWRDQELAIMKKGSETYIFNENLSGETRVLKSTKMAFFIQHLNQVGLLGIQTDITELQKLKELAGVNPD